MARQRSTSPKPWRQFEARTTFLRVPPGDWLLVKQGHKTEFRQGGLPLTHARNLTCPTPVLGYTLRRHSYDSRLLVLEAMWREPLGSISPESLEREGFPDIAHFRRYWMGKTHRRFNVMREVQVYRVRPFTPEDRVTMGLELLDKLYGEHLEGVRERR